MVCSVLVAGLVILVAFLYVYIKEKLCYWQERGVPVLKPTFLFGNIDGIGSKVHLVGRHQEIYEKFKGSHQFAGLYFLTEPKLIALDLDAIRTVLVKEFSTFRDRGFFHDESYDPLSGGLFSLDGDLWHNMRSKLSPTFTSGKIRGMYAIMSEKAGDFAAVLNETAELQTPLDIKDLCIRFAADVIAASSFGLEVNCLKSPDAQFMIEAKRAFDFRSVKRRLSTFVQMSFPKIAQFLKLRTLFIETEDYFMNIIKDATSYREKNPSDRADFLNLLLDIYKKGIVKGETTNENVGKITFNQMAAQAFLFLVAGYETTASVLAYTFYELAKNPDIQRRAREEIRKVLAHHNGEFTYDAVNEMEFVRQIMDESLRLYPPGHTLFRQSVQDYTFPDSGFTIPKGTQILVPVYAIHHDPEIYPDPETYDPDRFSTENMKTRHKYSFLPFGEGPRNCIGMRFAQTEAHMVIARTIMSFEFSVNAKTADPFVLDVADFNLNALGGLWLNVQKLSA